VTALPVGVRQCRAPTPALSALCGSYQQRPALPEEICPVTPAARLCYNSGVVAAGRFAPTLGRRREQENTIVVLFSLDTPSLGAI
jgi:hypothetical protein